MNAVQSTATSLNNSTNATMGVQGESAMGVQGESDNGSSNTSPSSFNSNNNVTIGTPRNDGANPGILITASNAPSTAPHDVDIGDVNTEQH
jgi:hypothetical protein